MICFAKPGLTEDLYIVHKEEFSITCHMCDMCETYSYETNPSSYQRGCYIRTMTARVQLKKKSSVVRQWNMVMSPVGLRTKDCAGEGRQQFTRQTVSRKSKVGVYGYSLESSIALLDTATRQWLVKTQKNILVSTHTYRAYPRKSRAWRTFRMDRHIYFIFFDTMSSFLRLCLSKHKTSLFIEILGFQTLSIIRIFPK
jgi:hypothetical protein